MFCYLMNLYAAWGLKLTNDVTLTRWGFFRLSELPDDESLREYYTSQYFQQQKEYTFERSEEEMAYIKMRFELKLHAVQSLDNSNDKIAKKALEIGVGEGFNLNYLRNNGYSVKGFDFSKYAAVRSNPDLVPFLHEGDIDEFFASLMNDGEKFDLIWLDNVLEHVRDADKFIEQIAMLLVSGGRLFIEVPNDFSATQNKLFEEKIVDSAYWISVPDHINYFNKNGLKNLCMEYGLKSELFFSDFPIDFSLFNPDTNYRANPSRGKNCFNSVVQIESLFHSLGMDAYLELTSTMAENGLGRCICGVFRK
jgi:SAM-dependent methyltransferase